jgi:GT2 family glycosyltransferase
MDESFSIMELSIIILNYNTFELTCNCIRSIKEKTIGVRYELLLVDNASTERDASDFLLFFPEIILIKNDVNAGFAKGNNTGIAHASGEYILLLNSDTILKNNAILICKNFLEMHGNVGVVSGRLENPDGTAQHNCQRFPNAKYQFFELLRLQKIFRRISGTILFGHFFNYQEVAYPDWVWGTFFMFKKTMLRLFPGQKLSENFFMYVEDMQWCREIRLHGYTVAFEPEARVMHYMGKSGGHKSLLIENHKIFMKTYYNFLHRKLISLLSLFLSFSK